MIQTKPFEPAPERFPDVFVKYGWRGVERYFGGRSERNLRWLKQCGRQRLEALRRRYMRGDLVALEEARRPLTMDEKFAILAARKDEGKAKLAHLENQITLNGAPISMISRGEKLQGAK